MNGRSIRDISRMFLTFWINLVHKIDYMGLDWENACLSPHKNKRNVQTASAKQVRSSVYTGSSNSWLNYTLYINNKFDKISN